jgi:hypothetical protein
MLPLLQAVRVARDHAGGMCEVQLGPALDFEGGTLGMIWRARVWLAEMWPDRACHATRRCCDIDERSRRH